MKRRSVDWYILIPVLLLVSTGLIMVLSASSAFASAKFGKPFYFLQASNLELLKYMRSYLCSQF